MMYVSTYMHCVWYIQVMHEFPVVSSDDSLATTSRKDFVRHDVTALAKQRMDALNTNRVSLSSLLLLAAVNLCMCKVNVNITYMYMYVLKCSQMIRWREIWNVARCDLLSLTLPSFLHSLPPFFQSRHEKLAVELSCGHDKSSEEHTTSGSYRLL